MFGCLVDEHKEKPQQVIRKMKSCDEKNSLMKSYIPDKVQLKAD